MSSLHGHGMDIPPARPRPRPQKQRGPDAARESDALRASVLDAAMQLGLGANPAVADWMFNNRLKEEDEDHIPTSPGLTYSEESSSSSPLSGRYPLTPSTPSLQNRSTNPNHIQKNYTNFHLQNFQYANTVPFAISSESRPPTPHVPDAPDVPRPTTPSKLKKKRSATRDGYESDGGIFSDFKRKKDKKDKKGKAKKTDTPLVPPVPAFAVSSMPSSSANSFLTVETASDLTVDGIDPRKRTKSLVKAPPIPRSALVSPFDFPGYETDGSKKSKKKSKKKNGDDDEKDVKKARSLFFRLGNKSSKGDLGRDSPKPLPVQVESHPLPLPIAQQFATTWNKETGAPMISLGPKLLGMGPGPGSGLGIDLGLGLSGDMFSTSVMHNSSPSSRPKMPARPRTAESALPSTRHAPREPLPTLAIPHLPSTSFPPVSFPSPSSTTPHGPRPGSAGTMATERTSTSTNTNVNSYSTGPARSSTATSVSTTPSNSQIGNAKSNLPILQSPSPDVTSIATPFNGNGASASSVPQTPNKRRVSPLIGTQTTRSSSSSGYSLEKEKERKREIEKERERETKKPPISLPLTRDTTEVVPAPTSLTRKLSMTTLAGASLSVPNTPIRIRPNGSLAEGSFGIASTHSALRPSHPPVAHHFPNQASLTRQLSLSQIQPNQSPLSKQTSLTTLRADSPLIRATSPIPSGRTSPFRPPGLNRVCSPPPGLPAPPNVFVHYDIPPPSPPPLAPLPSVPLSTSPVPSSLNGASPGNAIASTNGHLGANVGIAVTTGSPLPSPLLMSSPKFNSSSNGVGKTPPTSFNPSSAAAGNALRAKVQRRLSQQGGLAVSSGSGANANSRAVSPSSGPSLVPTAPPSNVPVIHAPSLSRTTSVRGRESPFPVLPINSSYPSNNTLFVNNHINTALPPRATSPRPGWDDNHSDMQSTAADEDEEMEDVRDVIARFRESRIHGASRGVTEEGREATKVIATKRSFEVFQQSGASGGAPSVLSSSSLNVNVPVSPSPSSNVLGVNSDTMSGGYDNSMVEEYYGHGMASGGGSSVGHMETIAPEDDGPAHDDYDLEDVSHYPEDEIAYRSSRRDRSTVYMSDEEHDTSSNSGHGHGGGKGRTSRYSASIYSRASLLDTEKSGEVRQRFLKHVEAMLDERGERVPAVPPVPKLPEEFVAESRRAAAAARKEFEELVVKRTIGVGTRKIPAGSGMPMNLDRY